MKEALNKTQTNLDLYIKSIDIAASAHSRQTDKEGEPYIDHPKRIAAKMTTFSGQASAMLHDVIEDTPVTMKMLENHGFTEEILTAVYCLTRKSRQEYEAYIIICAGNEIARQVKIADLEDNMDLTRLPVLTGKDINRLRKYHRAWQYLKSI